MLSLDVFSRPITVVFEIIVAPSERISAVRWSEISFGEFMIKSRQQSAPLGAIGAIIGARFFTSCAEIILGKGRGERPHFMVRPYVRAAILTGTLLFKPNLFRGIKHSSGDTLEANFSATEVWSLRDLISLGIFKL
jgi:hypothetical protein